MIWCFKTQVVKLWLFRWLALEQCAWGYLLWSEVGCDATGRAATSRREPAWAAWADITKLLQLSCSSPLPVSVVVELWGTLVTSYLWITPRVPILERFCNSFGIYNIFFFYIALCFWEMDTLTFSWKVIYGLEYAFPLMKLILLYECTTENYSLQDMKLVQAWVVSLCIIRRWHWYCQHLCSSFICILFQWICIDLLRVFFAYFYHPIF